MSLSLRYWDSVLNEDIQKIVFRNKSVH